MESFTFSYTTSSATRHKGTNDKYINKLKKFQRALNGTMDLILDNALVNKIIITLLAE